MNVNGARNLALREGRRSVRWTMPWDGNCFLTERAWTTIARSIADRPHARYLVVPMARICSNDELSSDEAADHATEEPQIGFRDDAVEEFDERYPYGWRNKTELLTRIGCSGVWETWGSQPWDLPVNPRSAEAGRFVKAGWVARPASGNPRQERGPKSVLHRAKARHTGITSMIDGLDSAVLGTRIEPRELVYYQRERLEWMRGAVASGCAGDLADGLRLRAESAIACGTRSATHPITVPPGADLGHCGPLHRAGRIPRSRPHPAARSGEPRRAPDTSRPAVKPTLSRMPCRKPQEGENHDGADLVRHRASSTCPVRQMDPVFGPDDPDRHPDVHATLQEADVEAIWAGPIHIVAALGPEATADDAAVLAEHSHLARRRRSTRRRAGLAEPPHQSRTRATALSDATPCAPPSGSAPHGPSTTGSRSTRRARPHRDESTAT